MLRPPPRPTLFPYTTLFRSWTTHRVQYCINVLHTFLKRGRCIIEHPVSPVPLHAFQAPGRCSAYHHCSPRSEEHTSELQSLAYLVCRLLLEKKKNTAIIATLRAVLLAPLLYTATDGLAVVADRQAAEHGGLLYIASQTWKSHISVF